MGADSIFIWALWALWPLAQAQGPTKSKGYPLPKRYMHDTAFLSGEGFAKTYGAPGKVVLDVGGKNVNGTLRPAFEALGMKFICLDMDADPSVDVVVAPGEPFPFADGSIDLVVSSSCFEHDPCFWMTFREIGRVLKQDGYAYMSAPSNGPHHSHPGDNWRFYADAGQALAYWSGRTLEGKAYPMEVVEVFTLLPLAGGIWNDFVCVWKRGVNTTTTIVDLNMKRATTPLKSYLVNEKGIGLDNMGYTYTS